jgi:Protein of unknown function (DUF732)
MIRQLPHRTTAREGRRVPHWYLPRWRRTLLLGFVCVSAVLLTLSVTDGIPRARADAVTYIVNVTVRPGYNFANADAALTYGHGICDKIISGRSYTDLIADITSDFATGDDYQAAYLINQAVNELCPAAIWQLRNSAAHYRPPPR